jgi:hypothetical protein
MALKFIGKYGKLKTRVSRTGLAGKRRDLQNGHKQYRTDDGGILNWWETTGTISFQGSHAAARKELEWAFIAAAKKRLFGEYRGHVFCGRLRGLYEDA